MLWPGRGIGRLRGGNEMLNMVPEVRDGWRLKMVQGRVQERTECIGSPLMKGCGQGKSFGLK